MRSKKILVIGGNGSGKSSFALNLGEKIYSENKLKTRVFIATAEPKDKEMREKIKRHKEERKGWKTIEEPLKIHLHLKENYDVIVIDCLTMWITNLFFKYRRREKIEEMKKIFVDSYRNFGKNIIAVSNETGLGIIPPSKISRDWLYHLNDLNKKIGAISDEVYFMIAGIPLKLK